MGKSSSAAWGVFAHAERRKVTGRGYVVRAIESGHAVDQFNYGGIVPVAVFSGRGKVAAERLAATLTRQLPPAQENPKSSKRGRRNPLQYRRNPRRADGSSGWGPGTGYFSAGPIKSVAKLKQVATTILAHVHPASKMAAAAHSALRSPDFFMARPAMQEELLDMARRYVTPGRERKNPRGYRNPSEGVAWQVVRNALATIVDHAKERYPHFESPRGQRDIKKAEQAMALASKMLQQLSRGVHKNPLLGVIGNPDWDRLRQQDLFTGQIDPVQVRKSLGAAAWLGKAPGYVKQEVKKALARLTHDQFLSQVMGYRAHGTLGQRRFKPGGPKNNPVDGVAGTLAERVYEIRYRHASDHKDYKHSFGPGVRITLLKDGRAVVWHPAKPVWKDFPGA